ncbi:energy transducer TonB [Prolixibacteraceae bacterium Z1-6]|uniref:Energy transducer TonB n=1 Tax=Draconibacterium aestuarii TaxID=2998507 RepID=A0A9X3F7Z7_9BACT|nr:energy transducer TonB [Prolixibacteraceae bacterium Z1-6]
MKTIKMLIICICLSAYVFAQEVPPYTLSEHEASDPQFTAVKNTDQKKSLNQYMSENFVYPEVTGLAYEGTEVVQFVVGPTGQVSDIKIINSVSPLIDKEVVRVLKKTTNMWIPGYDNGVPVPVEKELSIAVKIGETDQIALYKDFSKIASMYYTKGAKTLLIKGKTKSASKFFAKAIRYKPYDKGLLFMHAICMSELGQVKSAQQVISRIEELGGIDVHTASLDENLKNLESFELLTSMLSGD